MRPSRQTFCFPEARGYLQVPLKLTGRKVCLSLLQLAEDGLYAFRLARVIISLEGVLIFFPVLAGYAYDSSSLGVVHLTEHLLRACVCVHLNVCYCVCSVCVTLFFIPGSDSIRIPYGTKLSLYMSKDAEGTAGFSHNSPSVHENAHNAAPLTCTCSQSVSPCLLQGGMLT